jgi:lipoprotein-anchoring transpeptidase ErfK/SrfK
MALRRRLLIGLALAGALSAGLAVAGLRPVLASASTDPAPAVAAAQPAAIAPAVALAWLRGNLDAKPSRSGKAGRPSAPEKRVRKKEPRFLTARVRPGAELSLHARPGGETLAGVGATTEFGSPQTLSVVERRGKWLGVVSPELGNGQVGGVKLDPRKLDVASTRLSVRIDISRRLLVVLRGDDVVRRVRVGIGRPGSPTPTGRFAVTDKLSGAPYGNVYGCCVLALTAHQTNLPSGWKGGDRMAIHGTNDPSSVGRPSSAGCLRAHDGDLRYLMRRLPLGTPVIIHP